MEKVSKKLPKPAKKRSHSSISECSSSDAYDKLIVVSTKGMKRMELLKLLDRDVIKFCQKNGLMATNVTCHCGKQMEFKRSSKRLEGSVWKCPKSGANHPPTTVSVTANTMFAGCFISAHTILQIIYMWVHNYSYKSLHHEIDCGHVVAFQWCHWCRAVCRTLIEKKSVPLGGRGEIVQLNEYKEKGDDDKWLFGAMEYYGTNVFIVPVPERDHEIALLDFLKFYILPGSTIYSEHWMAFGCLTSDSFEYLVNERHITFHDTFGGNIPTVEDLHNLAKRHPPGSPKKSLNIYYFAEYVYRKKFNSAQDSFLKFLGDVASLYPPLTKADKNKMPKQKKADNHEE